MKRIFFCAVIVGVFFFGFAPRVVAEERARLEGAQAGKVLLGRALSGVEYRRGLPGRGATWAECIEPSGQTVLSTPSGAMRGRLHLGERGQACFSYEVDDYRHQSCFDVELWNGRLMLLHADGVRYAVENSVPVTQCSAHGAIG